MTLPSRSALEDASLLGFIGFHYADAEPELLARLSSKRNDESVVS